ncbi:hypothetical protein ACE193_21755 [Bernardetia sp. OM2101]|uniref:hypothetical protein n=1 Tax=Bernardetia sp. OM2101 TaxID=3344876 RepID=UPI0035CE8D03
MKNSDRKYTALLKNEKELIEETLKTIPEILAVMSSQEVESCLKRREIAFSQKEVLKRIMSNAESLVINDNERYLTLLEIELELIEEEVKSAVQPFPEGLSRDELNNYLRRREVVLAVNSLLKRLLANTKRLVID